ncbi:hypothetical protein [Photobacterium damselae]
MNNQAAAGIGHSSSTQIAEHGVRNSLLIAQMPTASTAQIFR